MKITMMSLVLGLGLIGCTPGQDPKLPELEGRLANAEKANADLAQKVGDLEKKLKEQAKAPDAAEPESEPNDDNMLGGLPVPAEGDYVTYQGERPFTSGTGKADTIALRYGADSMVGGEEFFLQGVASVGDYTFDIQNVDKDGVPQVDKDGKPVTHPFTMTNLWLDKDGLPISAKEVVQNLSTKFSKIEGTSARSRCDDGGKVALVNKDGQIVTKCTAKPPAEDKKPT